MVKYVCWYVFGEFIHPMHAFDVSLYLKSWIAVIMTQITMPLIFYKFVSWSVQLLESILRHFLNLVIALIERFSSFMRGSLIKHNYVRLAGDLLPLIWHVLSIFKHERTLAAIVIICKWPAKWLIYALQIIVAVSTAYAFMLWISITVHSQVLFTLAARQWLQSNLYFVWWSSLK